MSYSGNKDKQVDWTSIVKITPDETGLIHCYGIAMALSKNTEYDKYKHENNNNNIYNNGVIRSSGITSGGH